MVEIQTTDYIQYPSGTTAQRPVSPVVGMMRLNTDLQSMEYHNGSTWIKI